jgi:hypothetical protein
VPAGFDKTAITFANAQECSFRNNEVHSYSDVPIPNAIRFETSAAILVTVKGWDITGNRFGDPPKQDEADVFTNAIAISTRGVGVKEIKINLTTSAVAPIRYSGPPEPAAPTALPLWP